MGTNFYWKVPKRPRKPVLLPTGALVEAGDALDTTNPLVHLGKRSAAGLYCWDCSVTFCQDGEAQIHSGRGRWHKSCPRCGERQKLLKEGQFNRSMSIELGFAQADEVRPTGVSTCSSFSWAQDPAKAKEALGTRAEKVVVVDEYGREYTGRQFLGMLAANCPVEFTHTLGVRFC